MKPNLGTRIVLALGIPILLTGALSESRRLAPWVSDFRVYYTAASLVRSGQSVHVYDDAQKNVNRFFVEADQDTVYATAARAHGFTKIEHYNYPPTLADLLAPLTFLSFLSASILWQLLNLAAVLSSALMLARMLGMRSLVHAALVAVFLLAFRPSLTAFNWGQVSFILLFLSMAALSLYIRGQKLWAGFLFALAAAIKLTPFIVIVPLVAWRDWKIVRAFALWAVAIFAVLMIVNGRETTSLYFLHLLPSMANGAMDIDNRSFASLFTVYYFGFVQDAPPPWPIWAERLLSITVLCYAAWLSRSNREDYPPNNARLEIIAIFLLFSCCLAPVSWVHAYVLAAPALVVAGKRIWERRSNTAEIALLMLFWLSLSVSTLKVSHFVVLTPLLGVAWGLMRLRELQIERCPKRGSQMAPVSHSAQF